MAPHTASRTTLEQSRIVQATEVVTAALPRLKIFPLPGIVLLPGSIVPLHVFEPRYRALVTDSMDSDRVMALANLLPDDDEALAETKTRPPVHPTLGAGVVVFHQKLEDGRSLILVQGVVRASIAEELDVDSPYRVVRALEVPSHASADDGSQVELIRHLLVRLTQRLTDEPSVEKLTALSQSENDPGRLADLVGSAVITDPEARQRLLEERCPDRRLEQVGQRLGLLLRRLGADPGTCN